MKRSEFQHPSQYTGIIGVAQADITPPEGIYSRNWGAAHHDVATGVHQPLTLTCLTIQAAPQTEPLILISMDLGWWKDREDEQFVRGQVLRTFALAEHQVMICLSHTHAGPSLSRRDQDLPGGQFIAPYLQLLQTRAVESVHRALQVAQPANLTWLYGQCNLAANRDYKEPNTDRYVVGFNPLTQADDTLLIGRVISNDGQILATLVNYACHPTTLAWQNSLISPDYVGTMRELVERTTQAPCLFLQGASGELAPATQYSGSTQLAEAHGRQLGYAVLSALQAMAPAGKDLAFRGIVESGTALGVWSWESGKTNSILRGKKAGLETFLKPMPPASILRNQWQNSTDRVTRERLQRQYNLRRLVGEGQTTQLPLYCWCLGGALFFGQSSEAYSQFQVQLRKRFAPHPVVVMNIVNGYTSYLPPRELYPLPLYAVTVSPFQVGTAEAMMELALRTGEELLGNLEPST